MEEKESEFTVSNLNSILNKTCTNKDEVEPIEEFGHCPLYEAMKPYRVQQEIKKKYQKNI